MASAKSAILDLCTKNPPKWDEVRTKLTATKVPKAQLTFTDGEGLTPLCSSSSSSCRRFMR